jgi:hypothetical protein
VELAQEGADEALRMPAEEEVIAEVVVAGDSALAAGEVPEAVEHPEAAEEAGVA